MDRSFWLEPLPGSIPITIDGTLLDQRSLTPLLPGMKITIGSEQIHFDRVSQRYLD